MDFEGHRLIHLIGIGGCSMNGLAQILMARGYNVQGSDRCESPFTKELRNVGINVMIGHCEDNLGDADLVIYSAAIKPENIERISAKKRNIPQLERSVALGMLSEGYKDVVGIAGCHGKTTITSMLALIAAHCDNGECNSKPMNATIHIGGYVDFLNGGVHIGGHELFITEACEYVESFLTLHPTIELISNIDNDHLDYYGDIEHIVEAFAKYIRLLPDNGLLIGYAGDKRVTDLMSGFFGRKITYGADNAEYTATNIVIDHNGNSSFDLMHNDEPIGRIDLSIPGKHNVLNATAAAVVAIALGAPFAAIQSALHEYTLTRRRFELMGERNGVRIYHDYAHHPSEIASALQAAASCPHNRIIAVFQCNSYTRAKTLFIDDMSCMKAANLVLVPDIYPGREIDNGVVHARDMVAAINRSSANLAQYIPTFDEIRKFLDGYLKPGDIVITLGSGDVYDQTRKLL